MSRQLNNLVTESKPVGRPLELDQKVIAVATDYVKNYAKYGDAMPSVAGLADRLEKDKVTLYRWVKENRSNEFSHAMSRISAGQERVLLNNGLLKNFDSGLTKLCLVNNHGYSDKDQSQASITVNVNRSAAITTEQSQDKQTLTIDVEE